MTSQAATASARGKSPAPSGCRALLILSEDLNSVLPPAFLIALENTGASAAITLQTDDRLWEQ